MNLFVGFKFFLFFSSSDDYVYLSKLKSILSTCHLFNIKYELLAELRRVNLHPGCYRWYRKQLIQMQRQNSGQTQKMIRTRENLTFQRLNSFLVGSQQCPSVKDFLSWSQISGKESLVTRKQVVQTLNNLEKKPLDHSY